MNDIEQLLHEVGKTLKKHWGVPATITQKTDDAWNVVTEMDIWAEHEIIGALLQYSPLPVVGEETGNGRTHEHFWTLDPIDGTTGYVRGIPYCTTMLSRIEHGVVQESYIYNFVTDELFSAQRGNGAYKNGNPIHVSTRELKNAFVEIEANVEDDTYARIARETRLVGMLAPKTMVAGHVFTLIAEGKIEGRITYKPYGHLHDYAPGSLLVEEAGGIVRNIGTPTDTQYNVFDYNFIAGNPSVVESLLAQSGPLSFLQTHN